MIDQRTRAAECVARAQKEHAAGALDRAVELARQAVLLYAAADEPATAMASHRSEIPVTSHPDSVIRADAEPAFNADRAATCRLCADYLFEAGAYPEAARVYQEAADLFALEPVPSGRAAECARRALECVQALRATPERRLELLTERYVRRQRQAAIEPGSELTQAEAAMDLAQVLLRRERIAPAIERYEEALSLLDHCEPSDRTELAAAECYRRIADMLATHRGELGAAAGFYRTAAALYERSEPFAHGEQPLRMQCLRALRAIERRIYSVSQRHN